VKNFMYENKKFLHKLIKTSSSCVGKFGYAYLGLQPLCKHLPSCTSDSVEGLLVVPSLISKNQYYKIIFFI